MPRRSDTPNRRSSRMVRLFMFAAIVAAILPVTRADAAAPIQPGVGTTHGGSQCTLNWIYDGPGGPYGGTAAHCVTGVGQRAALLADGTEFGTVALYREALDYALIRIDAEDVGAVNPALKGYPAIPAGVS